MKKYLLLITVITLLAFCQGTAAAVESGDVDKVGRSGSQFAFDLYRKLAPTGGNLFFSPYSVYSALSLTYAGSRGTTEKAMAKALRVPHQGKLYHQALCELGESFKARGRQGEYLLTVANSLWLSELKKVNPEYVTLVKRYYNAPVEKLNFTDTETSRETINQWVEKNTGGKVRELIPPGVLSDYTEMVLTNAVHFAGAWQAPFDEKKTVTAPFTVSAARTVNVPMMYQQTHFQYAAFDGMKILSLPYRGKDLSMVLLLPDSVKGLAGLEKKLSLGNLESWLKRMKQEDVHVYLPRFTMTSGTNLTFALRSMGFAEAFTPKADFSGITPKMSLSEVFHKASIDVNEKGTEAGAGTGIGATMDGTPPVEFKADHPFIFLIRDRVSGSILFMGRVVDPTNI